MFVLAVEAMMLKFVSDQSTGVPLVAWMRTRQLVLAL